MTAAPPRYRFVYSIIIRHSTVRGNVCGRNEAEARAVIAQRYGSEAAERAKVQMVDIQETETS